MPRLYKYRKATDYRLSTINLIFNFQLFTRYLVRDASLRDAVGVRRLHFSTESCNPRGLQGAVLRDYFSTDAILTDFGFSAVYKAMTLEPRHPVRDASLGRNEIPLRTFGIPLGMHLYGRNQIEKACNTGGGVYTLV